MSKPKSRDLAAALTGLVLGSVSLFLIMMTIVLLTNAHFEKGKAQEKAAPSAQH